MSTVHECVDAFPFTSPAIVKVERREELLLSAPLAEGGRLRTHPLIEAFFFGTAYTEQKFAPPRGVYESQSIRVEWQNMNGRQPFYHRNCGVDEISFQVCGERTLMTELGTVELSPGDFSRIPDGVSHDNFGRSDVHLLFYVPSPIQEIHAPSTSSEHKAVPFSGWQASVVNELTTEGVGGPGQDLALTPVDEQMLLDAAITADGAINVMHPHGRTEGVQWLYRNEHVCLGRYAQDSNQGTCYVKHRDAEEIQFQLKGTRTLVTQRGTLHLEPGEFVCIPRGVAFTSIHHDPSEHLVIASTTPVPAVATSSRPSARLSAAEVDALRQQT
jgi:mannose-6-phosphate isomerase-like protein (cupin superfamily)